MPFSSVLLAREWSIFFTGVQYEEAWQSYNRNSRTVTVYLQRLSEEQAQSVYQYFLEQSDLSIWTKRTTNSSRDGSINRIYLDVLGNPEVFQILQTVVK